MEDIIKKIEETRNQLDVLKNHIIGLDNLKKIEPEDNDPEDYDEMRDKEIEVEKEVDGEMVIEKEVIQEPFKIITVKPHAEWEAKVADFNKAIDFHTNDVKEKIKEI